MEDTETGRWRPRVQGSQTLAITLCPGLAIMLRPTTLLQDSCCKMREPGWKILKPLWGRHFPHEVGLIRTLRCSLPDPPLCPHPVKFVLTWTLDSVSTNGRVTDLMHSEVLEGSCTFHLSLSPPRRYCHLHGLAAEMYERHTEERRGIPVVAMPRPGHPT